LASAQLTGRTSLRDIETCLRAQHSKLYSGGWRARPQFSWLFFVMPIILRDLALGGEKRLALQGRFSACPWLCSSPNPRRLTYRPTDPEPLPGDLPCQPDAPPSVGCHAAPLVSITWLGMPLRPPDLLKNGCVCQRSSPTGHPGERPAGLTAYPRERRGSRRRFGEAVRRN
jgi:hypothetical protein